jgi:hypothetical protein
MKTLRCDEKSRKSGNREHPTYRIRLFVEHRCFQKCYTIGCDLIKSKAQNWNRERSQKRVHEHRVGETTDDARKNNARTKSAKNCLTKQPNKRLDDASSDRSSANHQAIVELSQTSKTFLALATDNVKPSSLHRTRLRYQNLLLFSVSAVSSLVSSIRIRSSSPSLQFVLRSSIEIGSSFRLSLEFVPPVLYQNLFLFSISTISPPILYQNLAPLSVSTVLSLLSSIRIRSSSPSLQSIVRSSIKICPCFYL